MKKEKMISALTGIAAAAIAIATTFAEVDQNFSGSGKSTTSFAQLKKVINDGGVTTLSLSIKRKNPSIWN